MHQKSFQVIKDSSEILPTPDTQENISSLLPQLTVCQYGKYIS